MFSTMKILLLLLIVCNLHALDETYAVAEKPSYNVVDGDTFDVNVVVWGDTTRRIRVRVAYIDTPEMKKHHAVAGAVAKAYTAWWLRNQTKPVRVRVTKWRDSFGRPIADLYTEDDTLSGFLLRSGVCVLYGEKHLYTGKKLKEIAGLPAPGGSHER